MAEHIARIVAIILFVFMICGAALAADDNPPKPPSSVCQAEADRQRCAKEAQERERQCMSDAFMKCTIDLQKARDKAKQEGR